MDEIILKLILACIPILGAIITYFIIPFLKSKISTEKLNQYKEYSKLAVQAAEMIYNEIGQGKTKKAYVVDFLNKKFANDKKFITEEDLDIIIEACVQELKKNNLTN